MDDEQAGVAYRRIDLERAHSVEHWHRVATHHEVGKVDATIPYIRVRKRKALRLVQSPHMAGASIASGAVPTMI